MQVLDACLKEITTALLQADVNVKLVMNLRTNVKTRANNADKGAGLNKRKIIEKAVVDELSSMLSSGSATDEKQLVDLKKGKPNVVMFVGLQVMPNSPHVAETFFVICADTQPLWAGPDEPCLCFCIWWSAQRRQQTNCAVIACTAVLGCYCSWGSRLLPWLDSKSEALENEGLLLRERVRRRPAQSTAPSTRRRASSRRWSAQTLSEQVRPLAQCTQDLTVGSA